MSVSVPMFVMVRIVCRGILGAGTESAAEKKENQFPFPAAP
jgi:hypothetical protein